MATKSPSRNDKSGRRRKITKFALAGVAVLGVGGALTSAAWTDNVFFGAAASSGTIDLEGSSNNGATWADGENTGVAIPVTGFANMAPEEVRTVTLHVRNAGQGNLVIEDPTSLIGAGTIFSADDITFGTVTIADNDANGYLSPNEVASFQMIVEADDWDDGQQGQSATLYVQVEAHT